MTLSLVARLVPKGAPPSQGNPEPIVVFEDADGPDRIEVFVHPAQWPPYIKRKYPEIFALVQREIFLLIEVKKENLTIEELLTREPYLMSTKDEENGAYPTKEELEMPKGKRATELCLCIDVPKCPFKDGPDEEERGKDNPLCRNFFHGVCIPATAHLNNGKIPIPVLALLSGKTPRHVNRQIEEQMQPLIQELLDNDVIREVVEEMGIPIENLISPQEGPRQD